MKVFISHSSKDYRLAKTLKDVLEKNDLINEAFIYEDKKELGTQISDKITREIDSSDYVVALITKNSIESASVNQEYGYAQALKREKIPFLEEGSEEGIMIFGTEKIEFSKKSFEKKCFEVRDYLIKKGVPDKFTQDEINNIQKTAHHRQEIEFALHYFLDSIYYRFNVGGKNLPGLSSHGDPLLTKKYSNLIKEFFKRNEKTLVLEIARIDFPMYRKLDSELQMMKNKIINAERFRHAEVLQEEYDLLISLKENLSQMSYNDLDVRNYCENIYDPRKSFEFKTCSEMMKDIKYESEIMNHLRWIIRDVDRIVSIVIELSNLYANYRKNLGEPAFKNTL